MGFFDYRLNNTFTKKFFKKSDKVEPIYPSPPIIIFVENIFRII